MGAGVEGVAASVPLDFNATVGSGGTVGGGGSVGCGAGTVAAAGAGATAVSAGGGAAPRSQPASRAPTNSVVRAKRKRSMMT